MTLTFIPYHLLSSSKLLKVIFNKDKVVRTIQFQFVSRTLKKKEVVIIKFVMLTGGSLFHSKVNISLGTLMCLFT